MADMFEGFDVPNTTPVPDIVFDELLGKLTGNELKVLLYIIRRTYGFGKNADAISLSQFRKGITTQDGKVLDKGCGVEHNRTILAALTSLGEKGYIVSKKRKTKIGDDDTTIYKLHFKNTAKESPQVQSSKGVVTSRNDPSLPHVTTVVTQDNDGSYSTSLGVVTSRNTQETVLQQTDSQETVIQDTHTRTRTIPVTCALQTSAIAPSAPAHLSSLSEQKEVTQENAHPTTVGEAAPEQAVKPKRKPVTKEKDAAPAGEMEIRRKFQAWIDEQRGFKLDETKQIILERKSVATLAHKIYLYEVKGDTNGGYSREEIAWVRKQLREKDSYWSKPDNRDRIGGYAICQKAAELIARKRRMVAMREQSPGKPVLAPTSSTPAPVEDEIDYSLARKASRKVSVMAGR